MSAPLILRTRIDPTSYTEACNHLIALAQKGGAAYAIPANVHVVMTAYHNPAYQRVVNGAALVTPDGVPLVWGLRWQGFPHQQRVYGPDLTLVLCDRAAQEGIPIYLYGGTEATLGKLAENLQARYPHLAIAGAYAPPFRPLTEAEEIADCDRILASGAKLVFVGLGCPKQEEWMARQSDRLPLVMVGVGAAFDFHSGQVSQAPRWVMGLGLEWLYRLIQEPRRLWRRYLWNNPAFVVLFSGQLLGQLLRFPKRKPGNLRQ